MKHWRVLFTVALFLIGITAGTSATSILPKALKGDYFIWGKTLIDPPKIEPKNTHFYLHLEGASAKALWKTMKVEPVYDECLDDGSTTKIIGNMQCTESKDKTCYDCYFSIDVEKQKIERGVSC